MTRPKAFTDAHFLRNLPRVEHEAITVKELYPLVGCKLSAAQKWLKANVDSGIVKLGKPANMGALTYYLTPSRPDISLPVFVHATSGQMFTIKEYMEAFIASPDKAKGVINRRTTIAVLDLWIAACSDEVKFTEENQRIRADLMKFRTGLQGALKFLDSVMNDPFLSGNTEEVSMAEDAIRGVSGNINLEDIIDLRNALRA